MRKPSPADEALYDIFDAFESVWHVQFTKEGGDALIALFDNSLGGYLRGLEPQNKRRELWRDASLKELPNFILGYVVTEIALEISAKVGGAPADERVVNEIVPAIMRSQATEDRCAPVERSYRSKVKDDRNPTPICAGKYGAR